MKLIQLLLYSAMLCLLVLAAAPLNAPSSTASHLEIPSVPMTASRATAFDTIKTNLDDYIWPTDASRKVTSSFAEYRSTHFHGGIDISTNGHTGYNVFAVRDGYVYRIRISPTGYGKMLYIKHSDGYVSTYSHLLRFNDAINSVVREEQYRRGTFSIDLTLNSPRLRVKKGDIVAYTGESGFGPAHLHFEIRDENLNPMNPMLCSEYAVKDDISPSIRRVMVSPLTFNSTVDNSSSAKFFSRFPRKRGAAKIPQTIRVHGSVGFGVEALDRSDGTWSKAGIHRMELYLDDSLAFALQLNRVPAEETKLIDLHYDLPQIVRGHGKFQKLYRDVGNSLPFYERRPEGSGIINTDDLSEGEHAYRIVCKDITGNRTELSGTLYANHTPIIHVKNVDEDEIVLTGDHIESVTKCMVFGRKLMGRGWTQHTLTHQRFENDGTGIELPIQSDQYDVVKIIAESKSGTQSAPVFFFKKKPKNTGQRTFINVEPYNDFIRVAVTTNGMFTEPPSVVLHDGVSDQRVELQAIDETKYVGAIMPPDSIKHLRSAEVNAEVNGMVVSMKEDLSFFTIPPKKSGSFAFADNGLLVSYDSGAVFKPVFMRITQERYNSSPLYELEPTDVLLNGGITFSLPAPADLRDDQHALYYRSNRGWVFQTAERDSDRNYFSTRLDRVLGELAVMKDNAPPTIGLLKVYPRNGKVSIGFRYHDNLSGVDPDEIKLYIDEKLVIPEIDGERHRVWYQADERLDRGRHSLHITMKDRQKNQAEVTRTFSVKW